MAAKHTPTPWVIDPKDANYLNIYSEKSAKTVWLPVASIATCHANAKANAAFIARAANAHDDLVAALKLVTDDLEKVLRARGFRDDPHIAIARAALAKAEA